MATLPADILAALEQRAVVRTLVYFDFGAARWGFIGHQ